MVNDSLIYMYKPFFAVLPRSQTCNYERAPLWGLPTLVSGCPNICSDRWAPQQPPHNCLSKYIANDIGKQLHWISIDISYSISKAFYSHTHCCLDNCIGSQSISAVFLQLHFAVSLFSSQLLRLYKNIFSRNKQTGSK